MGKNKNRISVIIFLCSTLFAMQTSWSKEAHLMAPPLEMTKSTVVEIVKRLHAEMATPESGTISANFVVKLSPKGAEKRISIKWQYVRLETALEQICGAAALRYRLEPHAVVLAEKLPNDSGFGKELTNLSGQQNFNKLRETVVTSADILNHMSLLDIVAWLTEVSLSLDPEGEGFYFALGDVDHPEHKGTGLLLLSNTPLLELTRYLAYLHNLQVDLQGRKVILRTKGGSNQPVDMDR